MKKIILSLLVLSTIICNFTNAQNAIVIKSEGSTLIGDNQVTHSGTLFEIDSKNISLKYLEKNSQGDSIHQFLITPKTLFCKNGTPVKKWDKMKNIKEATVITETDNNIALKVIDEQAGFYLTGNGLQMREFDCYKKQPTSKKNSTKK